MGFGVSKNTSGVVSSQTNVRPSSIDKKNAKSICDGRAVRFIVPGGTHSAKSNSSATKTISKNFERRFFADCDQVLAERYSCECKMLGSLEFEECVKDLSSDVEGFYDDLHKLNELRTALLDLIPKKSKMDPEDYQKEFRVKLEELEKKNSEFHIKLTPYVGKVLHIKTHTDNYSKFLEDQKKYSPPPEFRNEHERTQRKSALKNIEELINSANKNIDDYRSLARFTKKDYFEKWREVVKISDDYDLGSFEFFEELVSELKATVRDSGTDKVSDKTKEELAELLGEAEYRIKLLEDESETIKMLQTMIAVDANIAKHQVTEPILSSDEEFCEKTAKDVTRCKESYEKEFKILKELKKKLEAPDPEAHETSQ